MSLQMKAIDRLFERMAATYTTQWTRQFSEVPMQDVKTAWAHELGSFAGYLEAIAWALENLPPKCPNVIEFRNICRQAPARPVPQLPEPKADPARVAAELAKLADVKKSVLVGRTDGKEWARRIIAQVDAGIPTNMTIKRFAKQALGELV